MRPILGLLGDVLDDLLAGEMRGLRVEPELAHELDTSRLIGPASESNGARPAGLPARAGRRFRSTGQAPLRFLRVQVEGTLPLVTVFEHAPADLVAKRDF